MTRRVVSDWAKRKRLSARGRGRSPGVGRCVDEDLVRRGFVSGRGVRGRINHCDADHPAAGQLLDARGGQGSTQGAVVVVVIRSMTGVGAALVPLVQELAQPAEAEADGQEQGEIDQRATHAFCTIPSGESQEDGLEFQLMRDGTGYASIAFTTFPDTSVSLKSLPWNL